MDAYAPLEPIQMSNQKELPWLDDELRYMLHRKNAAYKKYEECKSNESLYKFKSTDQEYRKL